VQQWGLNKFEVCGVCVCAPVPRVHTARHTHTKHALSWKLCRLLCPLSRCRPASATRTHARARTQVPVPLFAVLLKEQMLAPFFVFQLFCVLLWCLEDYWCVTLHGGPCVCVCTDSRSAVCVCTDSRSQRPSQPGAALSVVPWLRAHARPTTPPAASFASTALVCTSTQARPVGFDSECTCF
jgi:hypothetical protein